MSTMRADFDRYTDKNGLVVLNTDGQAGIAGVQNGTLFTVEALIVFLAAGAQDTAEGPSTIWSVAHALDNLEVFSGVMKRFPESPEPDSMDNVVAALVFSKLWGMGLFAERVHEHVQMVEAKRVDPTDDNNLKYYPLAWLLNGCKRPHGFWNNVDREAFTFQGWHGRSPGLMGLIAVCAQNPNNKIKPTYFQLLCLWVGQFWGCWKKADDTDPRKLAFVVWQALEGRNRFWRWSYRLWLWILLKRYPQGMKTVYEIYYKDPNHPTRTYATTVPVLK